MTEKKADLPEQEASDERADGERDEAPREGEGTERDEQADRDDADEAEPESAPAPKHAPTVKAAAPAPTHPRPKYAFLAVASLLFFAADAVSKWLVVTYGGGPKGRATTDGWHLRINEVKGGNPGGAWGIFGDKPDYIRLPFFFLISAVAVVFVISLHRKLEPKQTALKWALPLLLGGALGNLIDRIRHKSVIDFLEFSITKGAEDAFKWPTFNVADIWIVAGVILMAIDMFTPRKKVPPKVIPDDEAEAPRVARNMKRGASAGTADAAKEKAAKAEA